MVPSISPDPEVCSAICPFQLLSVGARTPGQALPAPRHNDNELIHSLIGPVAGRGAKQGILLPGNILGIPILSSKFQGGVNCLLLV